MGWIKEGPLFGIMVIGSVIVLDSSLLLLELDTGFMAVQ